MKQHRREFLQTTVGAGAAMMGLTLPVTATSLKWEDKSKESIGEWHELDLGVSKIIIFRYVPTDYWIIRGDAVFHRNKFRGTADEAKIEAVRFVRMQMQSVLDQLNRAVS